MQDSRICLLMSGIFLIVTSNTVFAETLQPDPAWQQGKLDNGFRWQVLATPQRPSDRTELRLLVNTGSLAETSQQAGYSHLLSRMALVHNTVLSTTQQRSLWQQGIDPEYPLPPAITSYDFTQYNISLPNSRPDLMKAALKWLAATAGKMDISEQVVTSAQGTDDPVATWPANPQNPWWRYRLKGSPLLTHDPAASVATPVDIVRLSHFYTQWYTPDAMTLLIVGNVDSRSLPEQINKTFSSLQGKRQSPAPLPGLPPLSHQSVNLVDPGLNRDRLSLVWDTPWQPIRDSRNLLRYWQSDLAREGLFWHVQQALSISKVEGVQVGFNCQVLYKHAQCAINMDTDNATLHKNFDRVVRELATIRDKGLPQDEFDALIAQKSNELNKLFATYAHASTRMLISQRLHSQQHAVVDIAPEQYQKLRQDFLARLTLSMFNQELRQQLSQEPKLLLMQPPGEPETSMQTLQENWMKIMTPFPNAAIDGNKTVAMKFAQ